MIFFIAAQFLLTSCGAAFSKHDEFNKDYISKDGTVAIKGIFVFLIFLGQGAGIESCAGLRYDSDSGASSPPLRIQQRIPEGFREPRNESRRCEPRYGAGRSGRNSRPSLVRRYAIPSRIQEHRTAASSAFRRVRSCGAGGKRR